MKMTELKKQVEEICAQLERLPWGDKQFYTNYLAQTHYFVSHSTRLLARCISVVPVEDHQQYDRLVEHLSEEDRHEVLIEQDLKRLGHDIKDFDELALTSAFYQTQFYKIDRTQGKSLYGYILFLEAIASFAGENFVNLLEGQYGQKGCSFVRVHTQEDPEHVEKALAMINSLCPEDQQMIWSNFQETCHIYMQMMSELGGVPLKIRVNDTKAVA